MICEKCELFMGFWFEGWVRGRGTRTQKNQNVYAERFSSHAKLAIVSYHPFVFFLTYEKFQNTRFHVEW